MNPQEMTTESLVDTLASLAVKTDATDLDLISSGRRLSAITEEYRAELLARMDSANRDALSLLAEIAIQANNDGLSSSKKRFQKHIMRIIQRANGQR